MRNQNLDLLKLLAAIGVILIHYNLTTGTLGLATMHVVRWSVPIFCLITGFYLDKILTPEKFKKYLFRILKLACFGILINFLCEKIINPTAIKPITKQTALDFFLLNSMPGWCFHLWYLFGLIYAMIFIWLLRKKHRYYFFIPLLLIGPLQEFFCVPFPHFLTIIVPFVCLGRWLRQEKIQHIPNNMLLLIFVISTILVEVEAQFIGKSLNIYFSTIAQAVSMFIFAIKDKNRFNGKILPYLGRNYSSYIYITHVMVGFVVCHVLKTVQGNAIVTLLTILGSVSISALYVECIKKPLTSTRISILLP